jgi:PAS domain S-box-containing protein
MSVFDVQMRIRTRNGEAHWVQASSTPRLLPDGRILWDGILMDITGRKREEAAREESEGRFRLVIENAELPVVIASMEDKKILFINECAARYLEIPLAEARGLHAPDLWHDPAARERFLAVLLEAGRVSGFEVEMRTATGQDRWASVSASIINYGGQRATFAVFNDITALKEAAAKLEHEREVLSAIFQTAPDMIWMKDAEGRYVACNPATERFFVLPASAIIGKMDHEIFPAEITEVIRAEDRAAIAAGGYDSRGKPAGSAGNHQDTHARWRTAAGRHPVCRPRYHGGTPGPGGVARTRRPAGTTRKDCGRRARSTLFGPSTARRYAVS